MLLGFWVFWGTGRSFFSSLECLFCHSWFEQPGASKDHDGGTYPFLPLNQFWFQEFESDPDGAKFISLKKLSVLIGLNVRG